MVVLLISKKYENYLNQNYTNYWINRHRTFLDKLFCSPDLVSNDFFFFLCVCVCVCGGIKNCKLQDDIKLY